MSKHLRTSPRAWAAALGFWLLMAGIPIGYLIFVAVTS